MLIYQWVNNCVHIELQIVSIKIKGVRIIKTIFLDFDGVLFDTVLESYLLARYAYKNIEPQERIDISEYEFFHSVRFLIVHSWNYYYLISLIEQGIPFQKFPQEYQKAVLNRNIEDDSSFDKKFQEKRIDLITNHFDFWNKLDKPYPFFEKIKSIAKDYNIIIVSTKNEEAILRHCRDYGFDTEEKNIVGKTKLKQFGSKKVCLENYISKNDIRNSIFIDDSKTTIEDCSNIANLKTYMANWGYVANKNEGLNEDEILNIIKEK